MDFAANSLRMGGRLVYLLPTTPDFKEEELPSHPCLRLHAVSEQVLRHNFSRLLITMVKDRPFSRELKAARRDKQADPSLPSFGNMKDLLYKRIEDALQNNTTGDGRTPEPKRPKTDEPSC